MSAESIINKTLRRIEALVRARLGPGGTVAVTGPLTDAQLRAAAVPVQGPLTNGQLRAAPVVVAGPLTQAQLQAMIVAVRDANIDTTLTGLRDQLVAALEALGDTITGGPDYPTNLADLLTALEALLLELEAKADPDEAQLVSLPAVLTAQQAIVQRLAELEAAITGADYPGSLSDVIDTLEDVLAELQLKADLTETQPVSLPASPQVTATSLITNGTSLGASSGLLPGVPVGVQFDAAWDTNAASFQGSYDNVVWTDMRIGGVEISIAGVVASSLEPLNPEDFRAPKYLKVRSGLSAAPVNQVGNTTVTIICYPGA